MTTNIENTADTLNRHAVAYNPTIQQQLRQGLEYQQDMTVRACDNTWSAPNATAGDLMQPYQSAFTPTGTVVFDAEELKLQKVKIDVEMTADDLEKYFESWRVDWNEIGLPENEWSFPRWIYDNIIMPKLMEEENLNAFKGVYAPPTPGTAGVSLSSVDGLELKLQQGVAAGKIVEVVTGPMTATNAVDRIEAFCDGLPELYRNLPGKLIVSHTNERFYARDYRDKFGFGNGVGGNENSGLRVDYSNKRVIGRHYMAGSQGIIFIPDNRPNLVWGTRSGFPTTPQIRWKTEGIRTVKGTAEWYRFFGFEYAHEVFINDQFTTP